MNEPQDFELTATETMPEISSKVSLYRHRGTGAEVLSLENNDENKVFGVAFRTAPGDSTGAAHILEHTVLAGSEKYPVKEPFIELVKGSLASFVNAMTFEDKTVYPVASQNQQDFYNLIDVYLDAVFHPLLKKTTFEREGWHYTLEQPDAQLGLKGVVFNEMKGQISNPDYVLYKDVIATLFPDTPYASQSGGHPANIPDLTFEAFTRFYHVNYHPSNARFFFYGDDPLAERFNLIRPYLEGIEPGPASPQVDPQQSFDAPVAVSRPYPAASEKPEDQKHALSVGWLLPVNDDQLTALSSTMLAHILMGTPAAPLRKALIESGMGEDVFGSGTDGNMSLFDMLRQLHFYAGLKGVKESDVEAVEKLILDTLHSLADEGIDPETVHASINTIEFQLRENNYGRLPRGLVLFIRALSTWKYGGDPFDPLRFSRPLEAIKQALQANPRYFEEWIIKHILENPHRVTLHMDPDPAFQEKLETAEHARLERTAGSLSEKQRKQIYERTLEIQHIQETPDRPEDLAKLPMLKLNDLEKQVRSLPIEIIEDRKGPIWVHPLPTNGIVYADFGFDLHALPARLLPYLSLFGRALLEMGTQQREYVELSQRIGSQTGGIEPSTLISSQLRSDQSQSWFFLRGKAMVEQTEELTDLVREILLEPRFDQKDRFRQIAVEEKARFESELIPAGHQLVNGRIHSGFDEAGWVEEQIDGFESLFFLRKLIKRLDTDWSSVLEDLQAIHRLLITRPAALFNLTFTEGDWSGIEPHIKSLREALPDTETERLRWTPAFETGNQGLSLPAQVNYVGKGARLAAFPETIRGHMYIASLLLNTTWLWERVRLQGGAYGSWCLFDPLSHYVGLVSYRDPQILDTLRVFDATADYLQELKLDAPELTKGIIGVIGRMDAYMLPDAKGFTSMSRRLTALTDDIRQAWRDQVLSATNRDLQALADIFTDIAENGRVVVLGSQAALEKASTEKGADWMEISPVL
ncbi:MAG: insulinase family protein [Anaerolineales bacterium]